MSAVTLADAIGLKPGMSLETIEALFVEHGLVPKRSDLPRERQDQPLVGPEDVDERIDVDGRSDVLTAGPEALHLLRGELESLRTAVHRLDDRIGKLLAQVESWEVGILVAEQGHACSSQSSVGVASEGSGPAGSDRSPAGPCGEAS